MTIKLPINITVGQNQNITINFENGKAVIDFNSIKSLERFLHILFIAEDSVLEDEFIANRNLKDF